MDTLTIQLPAETAAQLKREADARGVSAETIASEMIEATAAADALDWEEDFRRLDEPGENIPLDQAFDSFRAKIAEARARAK